MLTYLQSVTALHNTEREGRNYLIGEVEMCRAKVSHAEESIQMLNSQLTELENRHEYVKNNFVDNLSHTEFVGNEYFEQLVNDQSDKQFFNNLIRRQLLDVRSSTNENFPGEEPNDKEEDAKIARAKSDATMRANNFEEISAIEDTEQLVRRLGVRNRRERHALDMELREALLRESKLRAELNETQEKLEDQTERADEAEDNLYSLRAQNDSFKDRVAHREATIETEANEYFDLAATASMMESDMTKKVQSVAPLLMKLVMSSDISVVKDAAKVMQGLGVMTAEGTSEHLENVTMLREEMAQREGEVRACKSRSDELRKCVVRLLVNCADFSMCNMSAASFESVSNANQQTNMRLASLVPGSRARQEGQDPQGQEGWEERRWQEGCWEHEEDYRQGQEEEKIVLLFLLLRCEKRYFDLCFRFLCEKAHHRLHPLGRLLVVDLPLGVNLRLLLLCAVLTPVPAPGILEELLLLPVMVLP